ncbi:uncharacterized protein TNCV_4119421 [Trichonephila clavipes]|nr:uncharacterized protein TNCV_4119421 [Trichonephila clavipes]
MVADDFLHHENPPTWDRVEPTTLGEYYVHKKFYIYVCCSISNKTDFSAAKQRIGMLISVHKKSLLSVLTKATDRWYVQTRILEYHVIELKRVCGRLRDAASCLNGSKKLQKSASETFDMIRYD